jgi:ABC-type amino acid transport substrate-binding protein
MILRRLLPSLFALPLLTAGAFGASAQSIGPFEAALGAPRAIEAYPKPWPLKNLVKKGTLTVGTTGASPPRTFVDPATGQLTGSYVDLFRKIGEDLGLTVEFVKLEWSGILPGLASGRFDLACDGASWNKDRLGSDQFLMTAPTAVNATVGLALKRSGITAFSTATGKRLGGVRGEIYFESARKALPGSAVTEFPGVPESLMGLQNGQVDLVATNLSNALSILATAPNKGDLVLVGPALEVFAQSLCVNPKQPDLLVAVNTLLGNYRADGTLKSIVAKYATSAAEVELLARIGY